MNYRFIALLIISFLFLPGTGFTEGTKEFWPDPAEETRILIARGAVGTPAQQRDPFAIYNGAADYRLYIHISNPAGERILFGIGERSGSTVASNGWRIHRPDGSVIYQSSVPTTGQGFIETYDQAIKGPDDLDPAGYDALEVLFGPGDPAGDYYMTFEVTNNTTRTFEFFDITVVNTLTNTAIPGRIFSKNWQFSNPGFGFPTQFPVFKGQMYVYSADGIVTKLNPNGMEGRDFSFACNESGCFQITPLVNAQQARRSQPGPTPRTYPQYKIFLNNPDVAAYPDGIIGQLVDGSVSTASSCNSGTIDFNFQTTPVNAIGTVEIILSLSALVPPMVDRILVTNNVPGGNYTITWDGLDGIGNQVPSGSTFPFTLRYTNGLTHMPLWDVENNENGFIVTLIRPVTVPPLADPAFYWDDQLVGGATNINPPGCTVPPSTSCHAWSSSWGDQRTINTWWYLVSNSTANVNITYRKSPGNLTTTAPLPPLNTVCPGSSLTFTVTADATSSEYRWSWPGGNLTTALPTANITFPAGTSPGNISVTVRGFNADCGEGPPTDIPVTILPVPELTSSLAGSTCSGLPFSFALTSSPAALGYTWTVGFPDCSANIAVCPTGNGSGNAVIGTLSVTNLNQGTVNYHITPLGSCNGETKTMVITVDPKPNVTSPATSLDSVCSGGSVNIPLASGLTGPSLTWSWTTNCTNILNCPSAGTSSLITGTLELTANASPGSVVYTITPTFGGCPGDPFDFTMKVLQLPEVTLAPFAPVCLNTPPFALSGGSSPSPGTGVYSIGGVPVAIFDPAAAGTGTHTVTFTYTDSKGCVNSDQADILVQSLITPTISGDASACLGVGESFISDAGMADYLWSATPDGSVSSSGNGTTITWPTTGSKTIHLTYTDPNGCTTLPAVAFVTVHPLPVPAITGNFNVCVGKSYTYTTQTGMTGYTWSTSPGNGLTSVDNTAGVAWNITGAGWIGVNFIDVNGCTAVSPIVVPVTVNPSPVFTVSGPMSVCAGSSTTYNLQGTEKGNWVLGSNGVLVPPVLNTNSVTVNWTASNTPAQTSLTVDYTNALGCDGSTLQTIDIQPLPVVTYSTSTPSPVCQDFPTASVYTVTPGGPAASYSWTVSPPSLAVIADPTANPAQVTWKLPGSSPQMASLNLTAVTTATNPSCTASASPLTVTINPKPPVMLTACFDAVTTTLAKPIFLKGGSPLGSTGKYTIDFTGGTPVSWFNPGAAGAGTHTVYYGYTNADGCIAYDSKTISVLALPPFSCGNTLTDPRDNQSYPTVQIGAQCWMKANLRYASPAPYSGTPYTTPQSDNCVFERYCLSGDANCAQYGGFYQWDEVMQYNADLVTTRQGFCPPGWHVPTESDWNLLINEVSQNTGSGIAGAFLSDMTPTAPFRADPAGIFYQNSMEAFTTAPVKGMFFWTSAYDPTSGRVVARGINSENPSVSRYEAVRADAFPVRCIRD